MFPDDWRYEFIVESLNLLTEYDNPDDILNDLQGDDYDHDLLSWMASRNSRSSYCDEVIDNFGYSYPNIMDAIRDGQRFEKEEVLQQVRTFLKDRIEQLEVEQLQTEIEQDKKDLGL